jgi:signal transduction histidine kinase
VAELYEPVAAEKEQTLQVDVPGSAMVFGDRDLLFQALGNLVDNAVKYTPEGGQVTMRIRSLPDTIAMEVADSGPGVPAELRDEVFRRFFRADHSRSTPGSGLGLSLVQAVIQLHGAKIELGDNGPGLRVIVRLPRPRPTAPGNNHHLPVPL